MWIQITGLYWRIYSQISLCLNAWKEILVRKIWNSWNTLLYLCVWSTQFLLFFLRFRHTKIDRTIRFLTISILVKVWQALLFLVAQEVLWCRLCLLISQLNSKIPNLFCLLMYCLILFILVNFWGFPKVFLPFFNFQIFDIFFWIRSSEAFYKKFVRILCVKIPLLISCTYYFWTQIQICLVPLSLQMRCLLLKEAWLSRNLIVGFVQILNGISLLWLNLRFPHFAEVLPSWMNSRTLIQPATCRSQILLWTNFRQFYREINWHSFYFRSFCWLNFMWTFFWARLRPYTFSLVDRFLSL